MTEFTSLGERDWYVYRYLAQRDHKLMSRALMQIPGLSNILNSMTPATHPGLLGVCLSGAGPTILALVVKDKLPATITTDDSEITLGVGELEPLGVHQRIGEAIKDLWFRSGGIEVEWMALEVDEVGATCREL